MPLRKVLVANRGEIAVRVIRACRVLGLPVAAVYSDADRRAPHVAMADEAYRLGPAPAAESYLRIDRVLEAARAAGADAIHPGYGFLSENADFAEACGRAAIVFVGPPPEAIRLLGDKIVARELAQRLGVPVVPGYAGGDQSARRLAAQARSIGLPLLVKAAAGGGGRGMRLVRSLRDLSAAVDEARREATAAFGDGRLFLERYIERPRHVEVQILADMHGSAIHLHERECSVQRRHQKLLEESPSTVLTADLRARMCDAALRIARAAGYSSAGTVEFMVEQVPGGDARFYFLEVNTRLQVEHPVTEMVTGMDLVALQLAVAAGERLPLGQDDVRPRGHAIEARICAEDAAAGFLPQSGRIERWIAPDGPWVRVDCGVETGSEVATYYDPMLAKVIVWGSSRPEALDRMDGALRELHVLGVRTNTRFLADVVAHPAFRSGDLSTHFLPEHFPHWRPPAAPPDEVLLALAAEAVTRPPQGAPSVAADDADTWSPWRAGGSWRNARPAPEPAEPLAVAA